MSYKSLCKTAEYFEDRARRARQPDNHERLAAVAKKYRLRAEIQRKLENAVQHERGLEDRASSSFCRETPRLNGGYPSYLDGLGTNWQ